MSTKLLVCAIAAAAIGLGMGDALAQGAAQPPASPSVQATPTAPAVSPAPAVTPPPLVDTANACVPPGRQIPADRIAAAIANPKALLERYPMGSGGLTGEVRGMITTAPQSLDVILSLIPLANDKQKAAIGSGLASAALACVEKRPDTASAIQTRVALLGDKELLTAYTSSSGNTATAALGTSAPSFVAGPGGGGGPAPSLGTGFAPGSYGGGSFAGVDVKSNNLFSSAYGSASDSLTVSRRSAVSVSPTRP